MSTRKSTRVTGAHDSGAIVLKRGPACRCHSDQVYGSLYVCPACGHRSFDAWAMSCERERCGYQKWADIPARALARSAAR